MNLENFYIRNFFLSLVVISFSGCSLIISKNSDRKIYVLGSHSLEQGCSLETENKSALEISQLDSVALYHSSKIWFKKGSELGYYQFAEFSEPVVDQLGRILKERLRCEQLDLSKSIKLNFTVLDFIHHADSSPGQMIFKVRISLNAQFTKDFEYKTKLETYDATGVVKAGDELIEAFQIDLISFIKDKQHRLG
jgi:hypothetical protein